MQALAKNINDAPGPILRREPEEVDRKRAAKMFLKHCKKIKIGKKDKLYLTDKIK